MRVASKSTGKKSLGSRIKNLFSRKKDSKATGKRRVVTGGAG